MVSKLRCVSCLFGMRFLPHSFVSSASLVSTLAVHYDQLKHFASAKCSISHLCAVFVGFVLLSNDAFECAVYPKHPHFYHV